MRNSQRRHRVGTLAVAGLALLAGGRAARAQEGETTGEPVAAAHPLAPLTLLVGNWEGAIDGKLGTGRGVREYELVMGDLYLASRHRSVRLPQEKSPEGDEHEELGVFSFDRERGTIVYREFMGEGVVVRSPCTVDGMKVVCVAEAVESGPGIRARLTIEITDRYRFTETYDLAFPGRELERYFTNVWTRSPVSVDWD